MNQNEMLRVFCTEKKQDNQQHMLEWKELIKEIISGELVKEKHSVWKFIQRYTEIEKYNSIILTAADDKTKQKWKNLISILQYFFKIEHFGLLSKTIKI